MVRAPEFRTHPHQRTRRVRQAATRHDKRRHVVACRGWSQLVELVELVDAGEYGAPEHEPFLTFGGEHLLAIKVMFFAVSLQRSLGDFTMVIEKNLSRILN